MRVLSGVAVAIALMCPATSGAQTTTEASGPPRAFVEINLLSTTRSDSAAREFTSRFVTFGEAGFARVTYPRPSRVTLLPSIDVGGGYITGSLLGLGINFSRTSFDDAALLSTTVPHPSYLNSPATGNGATDRQLSRDETAFSVFVTAVPMRTERMELRLFGGPTYVRMKAEMVKTVIYSQSAGGPPLTNVITITGVATEDVSGGGLGFNVGSDFTYFFTRMIGVRGGVRYIHANVDVKPEPLSKLKQSLKTGGPMFFLGARLRFGK